MKKLAKTSVTSFRACSLTPLFCTSLLAFVPSALAVDGVVLINQGTSVSGLSGCPHTGFPILICKSGSYRLSGNLTVSNVNTDAIDITAKNVTVDLNGFSILGPVTCTQGTYPVQCTGSGGGRGIETAQDNIAVRNGTVRGMGSSGVVLSGFGEIVDGVHTEFNAGSAGAGISVFEGIVIHCTATTNAGSGIFAGGTIGFNTVIFNGGDGILGGATVSNNTTQQNGQSGIHNAVNALYNTSIGNIGFGILNDFGASYGFMGNVMINNGGTVNGGTSMGHNLCDGVAC